MVVAQSFMDGTQVYHINVGEGRCIHLNPPGDGTLAKTDYLLLFHKKIIEAIVILTVMLVL